jgi:restriction endonuclease S subunit
MDLKIKDLPPMTSDEHAEFIKILSYSTPKLHEYFDIAKSVWETVFDNVGFFAKVYQGSVSCGRCCQSINH